MKILASSAGAARAAGLGLFLLLLAGWNAAKASSSPAEAAIQDWPEPARATARLMIARYGEPGRADADALRWSGNGPWAKTIVHRAGPDLMGPRAGDCLEQTAADRVPPGRILDVRRFSERLAVNRRDEQMTARSPNERTNFLLVNLAHEIASGKRGFKSADAFYKRIEKLEKAGKSSPYTRGLLFPPPLK
jgi:hypothetical protein